MHANIEAFHMPSDEQVERTVECMRLLSDSTRVRILCALAQGESYVGCLAELADATPAAVSQHLTKLRLAGIVHVRREGTFAYYSLADGQIRELLERLFARDPAAAQ
jgi:DNA-binding transcriptional ArsR family regulator